MDLFGHAAEQALQVCTAAEQRAAPQGEVLACVDVMPVDIGVARGIGDLHRGHTGHGVRHGGEIVLLRGVRIKDQHGRNALRHGLRGNDDDLFLRQAGRLLGSHDDVLVVREDEHDLGGRGVDLLEDVLRRGVHGLAALDDLVCAQLAEHTGKALACAHGDHAEVLLRRGDGLLCLELLLDFLEIVRAAGGAACGKIVMLHLHVLDLGKLERAVFLRLCQGFAGDVRVDVDLEGFVVLADDDAVADGVEVGAQRREVNVLVRLAHDIHRVEGKCDLAGVELGEVGLLADLLRPAIGLGGLDLHAAVDGEHGLEHIQPALAACVHDARLLQDGVLVHGLRQRLGGRADRRFQDGFAVRAAVGRFHGRVGGNAGHGQDRALRRLHHGLVGRLDAAAQGHRQLLARAGLYALQGLGEAAEQQREDDAGIAARAAQHGRSRDIGGLRQRDAARLAQIGCRCVQRHAHVRAGVAVGDGEDVQLVDLLFVDLDGGSGAEDHFLKGRSVNGLPHCKLHLRIAVNRSSWSPPGC